MEFLSKQDANPKKEVKFKKRIHACYARGEKLSLQRQKSLSTLSSLPPIYNTVPLLSGLSPPPPLKRGGDFMQSPLAFLSARPRGEP